MRYMQVIESRDVHEARTRYLDLLGRRGVALDPSFAIYVETVHRPVADGRAWLCYIAPAMQHAA